MTKKRKRYPNLDEKLERPWCFYCERDFDDLKILISHQKAKHFKCDRCGRRLNTAGGLNVHMSQVHKEQLTHVENAIQGRGGLDLEIFGMEGVPHEVVNQHQQVVREKHFLEQEERRRLTGNPTSGASYNTGGVFKSKRPRVKEVLDEIVNRSGSWEGDHMIPTTHELPHGSIPPMDVPTPAYGPPPGAFGLPARPGGPGPGQDLSASLDDMIADAKGAASTAAVEAPKPKKEKPVNLKYFDENVSPEEKMANMARYAWT
ncbi:hypothetical protein EJ04DRAFT_470954 [Polyplosphaeria fusca]|uniref:Uncharacterized protein n=1 Tax=Polyplosphaeria fusca TaxID=682080 RepID=A0A9P4QUP4_9PLEO|nr:hypothetical protein EJ04DRAFT_470954 [Polyplosphaeria fusca]